jgi:hypothetical protein
MRPIAVGSRGPGQAGQKANTRANNSVSSCPGPCRLVEGTSRKPSINQATCDRLQLSGTRWHNDDPPTDQKVGGSNPSERTIKDQVKRLRGWVFTP